MNSKTIFLTGISGFLGSSLAAKFLTQGHRVAALVRMGAHHQNPFDPIISLLMSKGVDRLQLQNLQLIMGDIRENPIKIAKLMDHYIDEIWHCAASFKYKKTSLKEIVQTNVTGTKNMLDMTLHLAQPAHPKFVYVSTAYVCGKKMGFIPEQLQSPSSLHSFQNLYEWSKNLSEHLSARYHEKYAIPVLIFRPTIIVGDLQKRIEHSDNGYYAVLRSLYLLREQVKRTQGDAFTGELNLRLPADPKAQINLVPIDFVVAAMDLLSQRARDGLSLFHISNESPLTANQILRIVCRTLRITGLSFADKNDLHRKPMTSLEAMFYRRIGFQTPYMNTTRTFETSRLRSLVTYTELPNPLITPFLLERINSDYIETLSSSRR